MSTQSERLFNRPFMQLFLIQLLSMVTFCSLFEPSVRMPSQPITSVPRQLV